MVFFIGNSIAQISKKLKILFQLNFYYLNIQEIYKKFLFI